MPPLVRVNAPEAQESKIVEVLKERRIVDLVARGKSCTTGLPVLCGIATSLRQVLCDGAAAVDGDDDTIAATRREIAQL
ncbi:MAG: hypothetical protein GY811_26065 [Myxococcales bacterium]|nr:hypothetical protein [Myxococcales bacterium]